MPAFSSSGRGFAKARESLHRFFHGISGPATSSATWPRTWAALTLLPVALAAPALPASQLATPLYPGPPPGKFAATLKANQITLRNRAISATWTLGAGRFQLSDLRAPRAGEEYAPEAETFELTLADGTRYTASAMILGARPQTRALKPDARASQLARRTPGIALELPLRSADGRVQVVWRTVARHQTSYLREELEVQARTSDCVIQEIRWPLGALPEPQSTGRVDGSPAILGNLFLGCEDPHAQNARDFCRLRLGTPLPVGRTLTVSFVLGTAPAGQLRRAFLHYLEHERAHPYRPFLHYNSWYDLSWPGVSMNESNCLAAIESFGANFIREHNTVMDAVVFDDGWDDPATLWQFHRGFPQGFAPHAAAAQRNGTRVGVWMSPFGGYGDARNQRLRFGAAQGYETNATGFSLAGTHYYTAFHRTCVDMIRRFGVNHFKFDGIASGMYARGAGAEYLRDTEAMRRLMLELRSESPDLYINLTTGSWPSPFWLRYADSIWRQGGDMGFAGKGSRQQQWLTYRDQEVFKNIVGGGRLFPLNSLMTQGVAYSRHGDAGDRSFNSAGFRDDVHAFFGSGTGLQELYIAPGRLTADDWAVLAEAAHWSRANADVLVDTHWIGGDPTKLEVYGYASWSPRKGIVMLRNPDDQPHDFTLDAQTAFELPAGAPKRFRLQSAWKNAPPLAVKTIDAGGAVLLRVEPFEVRVIEAVPR